MRSVVRSARGAPLLHRVQGPRPAGAIGPPIVWGPIVRALVLLATLAGCTVGPDHRPPEAGAGKWIGDPVVGEAGARATEPALVDWWALFEDPELSALVTEAVEKNRDLAVAEARVRAARAARGTARATLFPSVDAQAAAARQQVSERAPGGLPELAEAGLAELTQESWTAGFDASWELDLFGGNRRRVEAAQARMRAAREEERSVRLSLVAEVARNYFELRGNQRRLALLEESAGLQGETLALVEGLHEIGLLPELRVAQARTTLQRTRAGIPTLRAAVRGGAYRLSVLAGEPPVALLERLEAVEPLPAEPDIVPLGLRSELLQRRPDLRAAERRLAAETADVGAAIADRYPTFRLTAAPGYQAQTLGDLLDSASRTWSVASLLGWPLFRGGALAAGEALQRAEAEAALAEYDQAVLRALEEVEASLYRYGEALRTRAALTAGVEAARRAATLARGLFEKGLADFLDVLDAERELRAVQDELAEAETQVLVDLVAVFKALGGGWEPFEGAVAATP